ncbi:MAG: amidohydrolase family protein [Candidatus Woesearchaeota archaeon]
MILEVRYLIQDEENVFENVAIEVINGIIKKISFLDRMVSNELIIMPGLVNAHTHVAMYALRGYCDDLPLQKWLEKIWKIEDEMDEDLVYVSSKLAILEMLSTGSLAFVDQYFHELKTLQAVEEFQIYSALGTPFVDFNFESRIERFENFLKKAKKSSHILPIFNVHAIYTTQEKIKKISKLREKYKDLWLNIHAAETRKEVYDCYKKEGKYVIEYLDSLEMLDHSILAHCGWITKGEINILKNKDVIVVHNPSSNMKLATGANFPYVELKNAKVIICLGTDGAASNNSLNMFQEMKIMALLNKHNYWNAEAINAKDALKAAFSGWKIFNKDYKLIPGNEANFIVIDGRNITLQPLRKDNIFSNLVYSFDGKIKEAYIKGEKVFDEIFFKKKFEELMREIEKINALYKSSETNS